MRAITVTQCVQAAMVKPYRYGTSDCFFLALDVIDALRGTTLRKTYAKRYRTLAGAQRALRKEGHQSLVGLLTAILGDPAPAGSAQIGDVAVCEINDQEHTAFWNGSAWFSRTPKGPRLFSHADVKAAFKV